MAVDKEVIHQIIRLRFIYSMTGLLLGSVCMIGGMILFLHGVTGATSWTARIFGNESTISDAAPGAILFVIGLFVVIVTRFKVKLDSDSGDGPNKESIRIEAYRM